MSFAMDSNSANHRARAAGWHLIHSGEMSSHMVPTIYRTFASRRRAWNMNWATMWHPSWPRTGRSHNFWFTSHRTPLLKALSRPQQRLKQSTNNRVSESALNYSPRLHLNPFAAKSRDFVKLLFDFLSPKLSTQHDGLSVVPLLLTTRKRKW